MPFTGDFSISPQSNETDVTLTDISTGDPAGITSRNIYLLRSDGSYITGFNTSTKVFANAAITWDILLTLITLSVLDTDYALIIRVDWIIATPDPNGIYTRSYPWIGVFYNFNFMYGLSQEQQTANPKIIRRNDFINNKTKMWSLLKSAQNDVAFVGDTVNAQGELNQANNMRLHPNQYF